MKNERVIIPPQVNEWLENLNNSTIPEYERENYMWRIKDLRDNLSEELKDYQLTRQRKRTG